MQNVSLMENKPSFVDYISTQMFVSRNVSDGIQYILSLNCYKNILINELEDFLVFLDNSSNMGSDSFRTTANKKWNTIAFMKNKLLSHVPINHGNKLQYDTEGIVIKHYAPFSCAAYNYAGSCDKINPKYTCIDQFIQKFQR